MIPRKPLDVDELIDASKESQVSKTSKKTKKFVLELPYDLWKELKMEAMERDMPLKDYLLEILKNRKL